MKVKELINFDEIKDVVDIDNDLDNEENRQKIVSKYIISERLQGHLKEIAKDLAKPKHNSCQIIGSYGSGKSHLLGFLSALLDNPELSHYIQDEEVKETFTENLNRKFAVVQFELQSGAADLSHYFYDRLEVKLKEKYGIEIPTIDPDKVFDHKEKVKEILDIIKAEDPQMGLVVIIDEISDFLKQKVKKEKKHRDTQFMRVLAQASQSMDFMLIGAMQENILTNPEFNDEADSFGRTSERYRLITISKEDIKKVISQRVLNKDLEQRERLEELLAEYAKQIPEVHSRIEEFIDLYPIHPYIIKIFNQLPYFEKRGVIQFTVDEVKDILNEEFPEFITFDRIFDLIASRHTIKSLDEVAEIVKAIDTLDSKIPLLRDNLQEDARRIVKALAILKLYGQTTSNGATPEEIANELLIISDKFSGADRIEMVLNKLREVTDGQFIAKNKNNYYYIDLDHTVDYDVIIKRKTEKLYDGAEDEVLLDVLINNFELDYNADDYERVYDDYSYWPDKKSFRYGSFIYDDGSSYVERGDGDFNFVFVSPYLDSTTVKKDADMAVLNLEYDDELDILLKRAAAIESLIKSSPHPKNVMRSKLKDCKAKLRKKLLDKIINAKVENGGTYSGAGSLLSQQPDTLAEYYYKVKPALFGSYFSNRYDKYPKLANQISPSNIKGEVERTIDDILGGNEKVTVSNSQNLLKALELLDSDNYTDTSNSPYARLILNKLKDNQGKNVKIEKIVEELAEAPYGLNRELVYLILVVLTYNGEANLKKRGGGTITASELKRELSSGLDKFDKIPYITLETDFPIDEVSKVFKVLDLNPGLIRQKKDRPHALREFRDKVLDLEKQIKEVDRQLENFERRPDDVIDIDSLIDKREGLKAIPISKFKKAQTVAGLKKIVLGDMELEKLEIGLRFLENITQFLEDFEENIYESYLYLRESISFIREHSTFFSDEDVNQLGKIAGECEKIVDNLTAILEHEDRRILKGKLQQYQRKYKEIYAKHHEQVVGAGVDWDKLEEIENNPELKELKVLKGVRGALNTAQLSKLEIQIRDLSQAKCDRLEEDYLEEDYKCPYCDFPEYDDHILENINATLDEMWDQIFDIKDEWEEQILNEIENYQDNIRLLDPTQKQLINEIKNKEALPERIDRELVVALNNLFSELREIEVSGQEIEDIIFSEAGVLDYKAFVNKLDEVKEKVLEQGDRSNIRIKKAADK